jgi:hypothetical protein
MARPLYPRGKCNGIHWMGGWVGRRAGLDGVEKRKNPVIAPAGVVNPGLPSETLTTRDTEPIPPVVKQWTQNKDQFYSVPKDQAV